MKLLHDILNEEGKEHTHEVVNSQPGKVVGQYKSLNAAIRAADRKDTEYGAHRYQKRRIKQDG